MICGVVFYFSFFMQFKNFIQKTDFTFDLKVYDAKKKKQTSTLLKLNFRYLQRKAIGSLKKSFMKLLVLIAS